MTDMRRTLLWVVFLMSLTFLWNNWNVHNGQPSMFGPAPARPAASGVPAPSQALGGAAAATPAQAASAVAASELRVVRTDVVEATLDSRGGDLVKLVLLKHPSDENPKQPLVLFDRNNSRQYIAQTGLITRQAGVTLPNHHTLLKAVPGDTELQPGRDTLTVIFESPEATGVKLRKSYVFKRGQYTIGVRHEVINASGSPVQPELYLQLVRDGTVPPSSMFMAPTSFTGPAIYTEEKHFQKVEFSDIEKRKAEFVKAADNGWIAMVQHYFNSAWLVTGRSQREFRAESLGNNLYSIAMVLPLGTVAPDTTVTHEAQLYAGPQEENKLEALAPGLDLVKDYGWFAVLAKPLFWLLDKLHGLIGNWGWAIVALVVLLKIAFYWLNASAYRSMAKMKAINPRIMEMRERLKDKPQQMQQEMMRIYREEKVNPLGGCLPILVQMPFFIALYWVLLSSVEMRNAPWLGWITDLSAKDPYYILPLLMTGSTLLQTWLNPTPPDPVQARMMWIMPLIFSVFFFFFPAGLVLYWLTNNILGIAQQYVINKRLGVT
ncbi:MAG TPA: membrane protein insertase YidC [Rhizobacter sp.]